MTLRIKQATIVILLSTYFASVTSQDTECSFDECPICDDGEGIKSCLNAAFFCNEENNCPDGMVEDESESLCAVPTCDDDTFIMCAVNCVLACVGSDLRCNAQPDCQDLVDELNCEENGLNCPTRNCLSALYENATFCVPDKCLCDGVQDCADSSDEENCDESTEPPAVPEPITPKMETTVEGQDVGPPTGGPVGPTVGSPTDAITTEVQDAAPPMESTPAVSPRTETVTGGTDSGGAAPDAATGAPIDTTTDTPDNAVPSTEKKEDSGQPIYFDFDDNIDFRKNKKHPRRRRKNSVNLKKLKKFRKHSGGSKKPRGFKGKKPRGLRRG